MWCHQRQIKQRRGTFEIGLLLVLEASLSTHKFDIFLYVGFCGVCLCHCPANNMRREISLLCLAGLAGVVAFSPSTTGANLRLMETSLKSGPGDAEIMSAILVASSAAAAYQEYRTDKFKAFKDFTRPATEKVKKEVESVQDDVVAVQEEIETTVKENETSNGKAVKSEEEPAPVKEVVAKVEAPAVVVVETPKPAPSVAKPKPALARNKVAPAPQKTLVSTSPKPVAVTMAEPSLSRSETRTASESLTDLVKQVGKTVEQNKQMEDLVKSRRQQLAKTQDEEEDSELQAATAVLTKEKTTKKRGIIRKAWRVTKKVVAPWRKWENIS